GGTWDSTTVIPDKIAAVITTVGLDHMHVLGNTITEIATQKAGIIQRQRPLIVGRLPKDANQVLNTVANAMGAPIYRLGREFQAMSLAAGDECGPRFQVTGSTNYQNLVVDVVAEYPNENAAGASAVAPLVAKQFKRSV